MPVNLGKGLVKMPTKDFQVSVREIIKSCLAMSYEIDNKPYLVIVNWKNTPRAKTSKYPTPPHADDRGIVSMQTSARTCKHVRVHAPETVTVTETVTGATGKPSHKLLIPVTLNTTEFAESWSAWQKHRREIKRPLTGSTTAYLFRKLEKWGPEKSARAINRSIEMGWRGLFEPEPDPSGDDGPSPEQQARNTKDAEDVHAITLARIAKQDRERAERA